VLGATVTAVPDILSTLFEASVTLGGFSGLFFAFQRPEGMGDGLKRRIYGLLFLCGLAAVSSITPQILSLAGFEEKLIISTTLFSLCSVQLMLFFLTYFMYWRGKHEFTSTFFNLFSILGGILFLFLWLGAFDIVLPLSWALLVVAIAWTLLSAAVVFAGGIIRVVEERT